MNDVKGAIFVPLIMTVAVDIVEKNGVYMW